MKRITLLLATLAITSAPGCAPESSDDASSTQPPENFFAEGKADTIAACEGESFILGSDQTHTLEVDACEGGIRWFERAMRLDRPTYLDIDIPALGSNTSPFVQVCLLRLSYTRWEGLNAEHPVLANWTEEEFAHETEAPCGVFERDARGDLVSVHEDKVGFDTPLAPGWYKVGLVLNPEASEVVLTTTTASEQICGDGVVDASDLHTEQCDDGNTDALDGCDASCQWNVGYWTSDGVKGNDDIESAQSLEGMSQFMLENTWRGEDAADFFTFEVDSPRQVNITVNHVENATLSIENAGGEVVQSIDLGTCDLPCDEEGLPFATNACKGGCEPFELPQGSYVAVLREGDGGERGYYMFYADLTTRP